MNLIEAAQISGRRMLSSSHLGAVVSSNKAAALEVKKLSVSIENTSFGVLDDVSFDLQKGEVCALVGESGSGKSVLCAALMGILPTNLKACGNTAIDGVQISLAERASRIPDDVGIVFQNPTHRLNPVRTIGFHLIETVQCRTSLRGLAAKEYAHNILAQVGLKEPARIMRNYRHQLSGGMNQRVMIALALVGRPKLLIADEPTSALDATTQQLVMALLRNLTQELEMALLLVTHDLGLAAEQADRVVVLYAGRVVEVGPTTQVFRSPRHPYTAGLLAAIPRLSTTTRRLDTMAGSVPSPGDRNLGCAFAPRCLFAAPKCFLSVPSMTYQEDRAFACFHPHSMERKQ